MLFLAGSSRELRRVQEMAVRVARAGIPLVHKWWEPGAHGSPEEWGGKDARMNREIQIYLTRNGMRAIKQADVVFVLWPNHPERSTCEAEMAFALAVGKQVVVTGSRASECHWTSVANYRDASDLLGFSEVARWYVEAGAIGLRSRRRV